MVMHVCVGVRGGQEHIHGMIIGKSCREVKICTTANEEMRLYRIYI